MPLTYVESDGANIAVELDGPDDGPLVVCSPGMGDHRDAFAPLALHLAAAGYRVARLDLRGHGDSDVVFPAYGDAAVARDFVVVIDHLSPDRPAVLVGASLSAGGATIAAGQHPARVAGLVLLGPALRNTASPLLLWLLGLLLYRPWGPLVWRSLASGLWPGLGPDAAAARAAASQQRLVRRPGGWAAFHATVTGADHDAVTPWLAPARRVPALVVMGDADPDWTDPLAEAAWVAANFATADTAIVPGAGHAPMLEKPDVVGPAVAAFLAQLRAGAAFKASQA